MKSLMFAVPLLLLAIFASSAEARRGCQGGACSVQTADLKRVVVDGKEYAQPQQAQQASGHRSVRPLRRAGRAVLAPFRGLRRLFGRRC